MNLRTRLIVFGGGVLPKTGLERFIGWAREREHPRVLIVAWASEEADLTINALEKSVSQFGPIATEASAEPPLTEKERARFLAQLGRATAVFFSGGDQNRISRALDHPELAAALRQRYASGVPFAGTSAGTAIMSNPMFAGDHDPGALDHTAVLLREGLGLCDGIIFDQHFLKRQRQNRLFAAILRHPEFVGIGVDEDTALAIVDGRYGSVLGPEKIMRVAKTARSRSLGVDLYHEGEEFDLLTGASPAESSSDETVAS